MYGMVVVDDKEDIVRGIEKMGNWAELQIEITGTASNGKEALDIIRETKPKLLITDIRMPIMDGLELIKEAKQLDSSIKIILLSGYDDFNYAQEALKLGAQEYLLKPAKIESIREAVIRAKRQLITEEEKILENIKLKHKLKESLPLLISEYFSYLVNFPGKTIKNMKEKLDYLGIDLNTEKFRVIIVSLDDFEIVFSQNSFRDYDLLVFAIINIIEETVADFCKNVVFKSGKAEITIILNTDEDDLCKVFNIAEACKERIAQYLELSVSIGIGRHYNLPEDIHLSYREAQKAVENRFIIGKNKIINIDDVDIGKDIKFKYPYELSDELVQYIGVGAIQRVDEIFELFIAEIFATNYTSVKLIKRYLVQFIFVISKELIEDGIRINEVIGDELEFISSMEAYETLDEVKHELKGAIIKITEYIYNLKKINETNSINVINEYIQKNYTRDISLNDLSKIVYISPSYISTLIKQNFGESFIERITRLRVELAKLLLLSSEDKVYEVAEKVGYSDRRYFSDIFKKYTGLTPKEYIDKYK